MVSGDIFMFSYSTVCGNSLCTVSLIQAPTFQHLCCFSPAVAALLSTKCRWPPIFPNRSWKEFYDWGILCVMVPLCSFLQHDSNSQLEVQPAHKVPGSPAPGLVQQSRRMELLTPSRALKYGRGASHCLAVWWARSEFDQVSMSAQCTPYLRSLPLGITWPLWG